MLSRSCHLTPVCFVAPTLLTAFRFGSSSSSSSSPTPPSISLKLINDLSKTFFHLGGVYRARDEGSDFFRAQAFRRTSEQLELFYLNHNNNKKDKQDDVVPLSDLQQFLNLKNNSSVWARILEAAIPSAEQKSSSKIKEKNTNAIVRRNIKQKQKHDQDPHVLARRRSKENQLRTLIPNSPAELFAVLDAKSSNNKNYNTILDNHHQVKTPFQELAQFTEDPCVRSAQFISTVLGFGTKAAGAISKLVHDNPKYFRDIESVDSIDTFKTVLDRIIHKSYLQEVLEKKYFYRKIFPLNHIQEVGLKHYHDLRKRIPRQEVEIHERVLRLAAKRCKLEMQICGSYRRMKPTCGDVDCIIWSKQRKSESALNQLLPKFLEQLEQEEKTPKRSSSSKNTLKDDNNNNDKIIINDDSKYIVDQFATGDRKFMGLCRLPTSAKKLNIARSVGSASSSAAELKKLNRILKNFANKEENSTREVRRLDIRVVPREMVPTMLLYFTGSASHNVLMRQVAINKKLLLNEYGLFKNPKPDETNQQQQKEVDIKLKRIRVKSEKDVFDALGMKFKKPEERD